MNKEKAYMIASKHLLCDEFPEGLLDQDESEVFDFIRENRWEPFEYWEPEALWDVIEGLAIDILKTHDVAS